ncbi:MAG: beta-galactosidase, partial [Thermoguttaceae bacterium]|nr:beta-galactosidase [Thermoguttaceae bacterium]
MEKTPLSSSTKFNRRNFIKTSALGAFAASASVSSFDGFASASVEAAQPASAEKTVAGSPYGVCAHVGGGEEWNQIPKNLLLMKEAGISWIRADFSWSGVERSEGKWTFDHLDKVVDETNKLGLQLLPILDYDVRWASPAYKHLDHWLEYVKRCVERYKDRIQYWEVWNEENLKGFWQDDPDAANYATLLKETYKTIKAIDSNLVVVYGGLAGVPADFFAKSLDAGAGEFFDVVNIHPYRGGIVTKQRLDQFAKEIDAFRQELKKRDLPEKPIWITEMGWATPPVFGESNRRVVSVALQKLYPDKDPKVAFFYDERYDPAQSRAKNDFINYLPPQYANNDKLATFLNAEQLASISLDDADMLIMPPSEGFPVAFFDAVAQFVKSGGTLVLLGGVPLYYETLLNESTGRFEQ